MLAGTTYAHVTGSSIHAVFLDGACTASDIVGNWLWFLIAISVEHASVLAGTTDAHVTGSSIHAIFIDGAFPTADISTGKSEKAGSSKRNDKSSHNINYKII